jgi:outer membrane protein OmpA-like peptidoglycan-associated protein
MSDDRVNYFKTHDDLPVTHPMNALLCAVIPPPPETTKAKRRRPTEDAGAGPGVSTTPPPTTPPPSSTPPPTTQPVLPDKICICKIDFCFDEDREVTPESRQAIVQVANWLNECPNIKVKVKAYCSREADNAQYNVRLSMARAVTVCNMLIEECGIQSTRLVPVGMGFGTYKEAYKPESKTRWAKQQNRRVIFEVIEGAGSCKYEPSFDCNPEAPECDKSEYCYRKDGTKFWRVGPHYFTGNKFIEEGGKSVGETYTGWPRSTGPIRPPGLSQGAFNSKLKLELPFGTDLTKRIAWHKAYRIQNPDETQGVAQQTYNVWFDPLTDAKQHFQLEGTAENPIITISGGDTPIDIWARRYNRDTNIVVKGKKTHVNTGFSGRIPGDDGLDNVTYIINPNK